MGCDHLSSTLLKHGDRVCFCQLYRVRRMGRPRAARESDRMAGMRSGALPLLPLFLLLAPAGGAAEPRVLLWAHPDQEAGATDSAARIGEALARLQVEAVVTPDLLAQDLSAFAAVLAVLGTFPRAHALTGAE